MRFYHSGDLGDLVYAIPSMRALSLSQGLAEIYLGDRDWTRSKWTPALLSTIEPLLMLQDFVGSVEILPKSEYPKTPFTDFSTFRNGGYKLGDTIYERQRRWVRAQADISQPWLQVPEPYPIDKIVINRTPRWEGWLFPWEEILQAFDGALLFIGLPSEHEAFCKEFGRVDYLPTFNLLDAARAIKASSFFIGNQSVCNAIANGLHHPSLLEVCAYACDCILPRPNASYCLDGAVSLHLPGRDLEVPARDKSHLGELERTFFAKASRVIASKSLCSELKVS